MTSPKIYENNELRVVVNDKFIYCSEVYMIWKNGAALVDTKYYSSNEPIKIKKKKKKQERNLVQFLTLEFAPEEYLINNKFKLV
jgi:hypothetical protein